MSRKKLVRYRVFCTRPIAVEMCRYEGSTIVAEQLYNDKGRRMIEKFQSRGLDTTDFNPDQWNIYMFEIEGNYCNVERWQSFDVEPKILPRIN